MRINADFTERAVVHAAHADWSASPASGVERLMLDRIGEEVARATSLVRFAPDSAFDPHAHDLGEEFLVLDGVFQDELGDFPAGYYVRNPPTSRHRPATKPGATILVKLRQFDPADRSFVRIDTAKAAWIRPAERPEIAVKALFDDGREAVRLERWGADASVSFAAPGGAELFVLAGGFAADGEDFQKWSWLRLPPGDAISAETGGDGAELWVKSGHLRDAAAA